jgi:hypothetical protein
MGEYEENENIPKAGDTIKTKRFMDTEVVKKYKEHPNLYSNKDTSAAYTEGFKDGYRNGFEDGKAIHIPKDERRDVG